MITFNYLAAVLADITGMPTVWIPAILALFGIGAFAGLSIGGRISDRRPHVALLSGTVAIVIRSVTMVIAIHHSWAVILTVFLLGIAAFVLNHAIYGRVFAIAGDAPTLAGAMTVSAFQLGISCTPVLAAAALTRGTSLTWVGVIGAVLPRSPSLSSLSTAPGWKMTSHPTRPPQPEQPPHGPCSDTPQRPSVYRGTTTRRALPNQADRTRGGRDGDLAGVHVQVGEPVAQVQGHRPDGPVVHAAPPIDSDAT